MFDICGYPTIEDNIRPYPPLDRKGKPYLECAALLGKEIIITRFQTEGTTICPRYEKYCKKKQYTDNDPITPECQCKQWERKPGSCLMAGAIHFFGLEGHSIIQDN